MAEEVCTLKLMKYKGTVQDEEYEGYYIALTGEVPDDIHDRLKNGAPICYYDGSIELGRQI